MLFILKWGYNKLEYNFIVKMLYYFQDTYLKDNLVILSNYNTLVSLDTLVTT